MHVVFAEATNLTIGTVSTVLIYHEATTYYAQGVYELQRYTDNYSTDENTYSGAFYQRMTTYYSYATTTIAHR